LPVAPFGPSSFEMGDGKAGTEMSCAVVQSFKEGSREVYIRRCESVESAACARVSLCKTILPEGS
jgi:hypothetical protein